MGILAKIKFNSPLPLSKIYPESLEKSIGNSSFFFADFLTQFLGFFCLVVKNIRRNQVSEVTVSVFIHEARNPVSTSFPLINYK
jgi:hypothetical protein